MSRSAKAAMHVNHSDLTPATQRSAQHSLSTAQDWARGLHSAVPQRLSSAAAAAEEMKTARAKTMVLIENCMVKMRVRKSRLVMSWFESG